MSRLPPIDIDAPDALLQIRYALELLAKDIDSSRGIGKARVRFYGDIDVRGKKIVGLQPTTGLPLHASKHQNGGTDEINVQGLSGVLADGQTAKLHKTTHQNGGTDEISIAGLSGETADPQPPKAHGNADHTSTFATETYADGAVSTHIGLADPHTQYQKESEKDSASGYAGLDANSRITKGAITTDDLIVNLATKGLVLKDTQGTPHYWRLTVTTLGVLTTTDLGTTAP